MVTLKNEVMTVEISTLGAEIQSVTAYGTDYFWNGDPTWWNGHAPVLFPICGRVLDNQYRYEGKTYEMLCHGFAKLSEFEVESQSKTEVVFLLRDNEMTRAQYPFAFEFRVKYALDGDRLITTYDIYNPMEDTVLPASVGSHEAYACPEGIPAYELVFEKEEPLSSYVVSDHGLKHDTYMVEAPNGLLPLKDEFFAIDALVFRDLQSNEITLRNRTTGRGVKVNFAGAETLLVWSKPGAPFVCIEPWCGFPDWCDFTGTFTEKDGMRMIDPGKTYTAKHTITLLP